MIGQWKQLLVALALLQLATSCGRGEPPTAPGVPAIPTATTGSVHLSVVTSGGDLDRDGYFVSLDTSFYAVGGMQPYDPQATSFTADLIIPLAAPGTHILTLSNIAGNCVVNGANPQQVTVAAGQRTDVSLAVGCLATGIVISAHTAGFDYPPSYDLVVDDRFAGTVGANDTSSVTRLLPGSHVLSLGVRGENCGVTNGRTDTVTVPNRSLVPVRFDLSCAHAVRRERIAFAVDTMVDGVDATWIVLVNPDGSGASPVVIGDDPSWSPDGTKLAYTNTVCDLYAQYYGSMCGGGIHVVDPERWTSITPSYAAGGITPRWSPAGDVIAFTRCCLTQDWGRIYLTGADGLGRADTSFVTPFPPVYQPSWSPDGQQIVVSCASVQADDADLCIVRKDGSEVRRLGVRSAFAPAWSPDGTRIAFTRQAGSPPRSQVMLLNVTTLAVAILTDGEAPAWSPDGTRLVVVGGDGLYVINADGTNRTRITNRESHAPAWRP